MKKKLEISPQVKEKEEAEEYFDWLNEHDSYIRGICQSKGYWRNGGWNGMMDAISFVEKQELTKKNRERYNNNFYVDQVLEQYIAKKDYLE